jgi:dTDP-glucose 4,6-dehydratase
MDGIYKLSQSDYNEPVNIGNPEEITILDFAKEIIEITGSSSKIVHKPLPKDDPTIRQPDITLAKKLLNWEPKITRREGLMKTIEFFRGIVLSLES